MREHYLVSLLFSTLAIVRNNLNKKIASVPTSNARTPLTNKLESSKKRVSKAPRNIPNKKTLFAVITSVG
jgi:hypothetical protein